MLIDTNGLWQFMKQVFREKLFSKQYVRVSWSRDMQTQIVVHFERTYYTTGLVVLSPAQDVVLFPQYILPSLLAGEKVQYFQTG